MCRTCCGSSAPPSTSKPDTSERASRDRRYGKRPFIHGRARPPQVGAELASEPLLRELLRGAADPRLLDEVAQLGAAELLEITDPDEHCPVPVPVRRREVDATRVADEHVFHLEV